MKSAEGDWSWFTEVLYACVCGAHYQAERWRWIDADVHERRAHKARSRGPVEGTCPECGRAAVGLLPWLEVSARAGRATLVLGDTHRADLVRVLREHLELLAERPGLAVPWILQPALDFAMAGLSDEADTNPGRPKPVARERSASNPAPRERSRPITAPRTAATPAALPRPAPPRAAPARTDQKTQTQARRPVGPVSITETLAGALSLEAGRVCVTATVDGTTGEFWRTAAVVVRPILLRNHGYPLLGVRLVASGMGRSGIIDAVTDVGIEASSTLFVELASAFVVRLVLLVDGGPVIDEREVEGPRLERNASMCFESARGILSGKVFAAGAFEEAAGRLAVTPLKERLKGSKFSITVVDCIELVTPVRTWEGLEFLAELSRKENLTPLLEVEGLPVPDYEELRHRVLAAGLQYGLAPQARFWRRMLSAQLAADASDLVDRLVSARKQTIDSGVDDLSREQRGEAWHRIRELCRKKRIEEPPALRLVFGGDGSAPVPRMRRSTQPPIAASGEIGDAPSPAKKPKKSSGPSVSAGRVDLSNPDMRLSRATDLLSGNVTSTGLGMVLDALDEFDPSELLAILPNLSELGARVVPGLIDKLGSSRREMRQAAAILLGMAGDSRAVEPMIRSLISEDTNVWIDVARALGGFGPRVIGPLCDLLAETPARERDHAVLRAARAMSEVVLSDGADEGGPGRAAVEALVDAPDTALAAAAREALGTIRQVRADSEKARGERPLEEDTVVRGFSRMAYEAITVPEIDYVEDVDLSELEEVR